MTHPDAGPLEHLRALADDPDTSWSVATFGAIAEFHRDANEPATVTDDGDGFRVVTPRGAFRLRRDPAVRLVAYEGLSKHPTAWTHGLSLCLPADRARLNARTAVTGIGADVDALRPADPGAVLFDLGLGVPHVDACVRTADADLIAILREAEGRPLLDSPEGARAFEAIVRSGPDRVFVSRLARIEVSQPIPGKDADTVPGPHTHVLPQLLARGRTHAASVPIPDGWLPCINAYPPNPARTGVGDLRPFDGRAHERFQALMDAFAPAPVRAVRAAVRDAVRAGRGPEDVPPPAGRFERTALRVVLRQLRHTDGPSPVLDAWTAAYEPARKSSAPDPDVDDDH